jgi:hypothetical protein
MVGRVKANCEMCEMIRVFRLEKFVHGFRIDIFCLTGARTLLLELSIYV